jgi:hypothetical protein
MIYTGKRFEYANGSFFREKSENCLWEEFKNNQLFAEFTFVKLNRNLAGRESVVIFANNRNFFIEIFDTQVFWGREINSINNFLTNGVWKNNITNRDLTGFLT